MTTDQLQEESIIITKQSNNISRIIRLTNPRFQDRYSRTVSIDFFRSIILVVFYHIATGQRRTVPVEQHEPILIKLRIILQMSMRPPRLQLGPMQGKLKTSLEARQEPAALRSVSSLSLDGFDYGVL